MASITIYFFGEVVLFSFYQSRIFLCYKQKFFMASRLRRTLQGSGQLPQLESNNRQAVQECDATMLNYIGRSWHKIIF